MTFNRFYGFNPMAFGYGAQGYGQPSVPAYPRQSEWQGYAGQGYGGGYQGAEVGYYDIAGTPQELAYAQACGYPPVMGAAPGFEIGAGYFPASVGAAPGFEIGAPYSAPYGHPVPPYGPYGPARIPVSHPALALQRPQRMGPSMVEAKAPDTDRVLWIGSKSTNIATTVNIAVTSNSQDLFSPRKVIVPGSVAPNFEIADLKIGSISMFTSSDPIPAESFIPNANGNDVHFDTLQVSQALTFSVTNIANSTQTWRASVNGFVARA